MMTDLTASSSIRAQPPREEQPPRVRPPLQSQACTWAWRGSTPSTHEPVAILGEDHEDEVGITSIR